MSRLPFLFDTTLFYPLQPEDSELEMWRRSQPQNLQYYVNAGEALWAGVQGPRGAGEPAPGATTGAPQGRAGAQGKGESAYAAWQATCRNMVQEVADARQAWKLAVAERDRVYAEMHAEAERLRAHLRELEARPKPPQPRKS